MNTKVEQQTSGFDTVKFAAALGILLASVAGFHYFADASKLYRVLGVIGAVIAALVIALQTEKGRHISGFVRDAQIEVRKVVWPTRQETAQTTLIVMIVVVIFALLLWLLDLMLGGAIRAIIGRGG